MRLRLVQAQMFLIAAMCCLLSRGFADLDPIVIEGSKFFYKTNGTQFIIKGIAYSIVLATGTLDPTAYIDSLADGDACSRDLEYLLDLGVNVVRAYAIDPTANHDICMNKFADAGIYVFVDLAAPPLEDNILVWDPKWNDHLYTRYTSVIDGMQKYTNVIGYFLGTVALDFDESSAATVGFEYVKAAVRDMKRYITDQDYRAIPVGYSLPWSSGSDGDAMAYLNCGDQFTAVDFLGLWVSSWCGESSYYVSGYSNATARFASFSVPVFFGGYGCNDNALRTFDEVGAIYGALMMKVFSGGIMYEYFKKRGDYGLVEVDQVTVVTTGNYTKFSSQLGSVTPTPTQRSDYSPSNQPAACPDLGHDWSAAASPLPTAPVVAAVNNVGSGHYSNRYPSSTGGVKVTDTAVSSSSGSESLSNGATIGIGVGVSFGAVVIVFSIGYLVWRRKRRSRENSDPGSVFEKDGTEQDPAALLDIVGQKFELAEPRQELPTGYERQELEAQHGRSEIVEKASSA